MSKYQAPPLPNQIVQEATEWFVEFNEGEVDKTDREAFVDWLKPAPSALVPSSAPKRTNSMHRAQLGN